MINFTTTLSYGLRFLANLAQENHGPKQLKKVAEEEEISLLYLRKLIPPLEKAGLIRSIKGPGGGFILNRKPSRIHLSEIINVLSRNRIIDCLKDPSNCKRKNECLVKDIWWEIYQKIQMIFKGKTLETIVRRQKRNKSKIGGKRWSI
ncbi:MAG TPA: Rrf2 family transcriptional regulator [Candidatus Omnitrophica bacterium]|nr:Rrf2 family transcriptional regulator [Candidatus Omnitrophota bacterium]